MTRRKRTRSMRSVATAKNTTPKRRPRRQQKSDKSLYLGIAATVFIIFFIIALIASSSPQEPRKRIDKSAPDIEKAQQLSSRGQQLYIKKKYLEAQKILKQAKSILHKGMEYYKDQPRKQKKIERMLEMVNERYVDAYHHSAIK